MNVDYPGSEVGGNTETHPLIVAIILGAMAPAAPDRVMASEGTTHGCFVFGGYDARNDEPIGAFDFSYVGYGGRSFADGNDATDRSTATAPTRRRRCSRRASRGSSRNMRSARIRAGPAPIAAA